MSARHRRGAPACRRGAPPEDASAKLGKLESVKTKELEDLDVGRGGCSESFEPEIADRYGERILAETDPVKRHAMERESKAVVAERRKASRSNSPNAARGSGERLPAG